MDGSMILHTVLFKFPDIEGKVPSELAEIVAKFNHLPNVAAFFRPHGVGIDGAASKEQFLSTVAWSDKTSGFTHSLTVFAQSSEDLKRYLHSDEHLKEWIPATAPFNQGIVVFDNELPRSICHHSPEEQHHQVHPEAAH
jgi:hypothetical protein